MSQEKIFRVFALLSFVYCVACALWFEPVTMKAQGDTPAYMELAKQFFGLSTEYIDLSHRQPLYSWFIGPFIALWGEEYFMFPVMYLQFLLVFFSSLLVFRLFSRLNLHWALPVAVASLYLLNLSTLFYAFNILTETLSQFIFLLLAYALVRSAEKRTTGLWVATGLLAGLMVLARFNTLGLPIVVLLCVLMVHYRYHGFSRFGKLVRPLAAYSLSLLFVLNSWCVYNYYNRGFYGLFPPQHMGQRWAIPATITEANTVSPEYQSLLDIFLRARKTYLENKPEPFIKKGSFLNNPTVKALSDYLTPSASGYKIYLLALPDILDHYGLPNTSENVTKVGEKLGPFYEEIAGQNQKELFRLRVYSTVGTFRAAGVTLPVDERLNLNALPGAVVKIYKLLVFGMLSSLFVIAFFHFLIKLPQLRSYRDWRLLLLILLIAYFPAVHFYANVLSDANRFKFPAEPIMIGMFVFYTFKAYAWVKPKWFSFGAPEEDSVIVEAVASPGLEGSNR